MVSAIGERLDVVEQGGAHLGSGALVGRSPDVSYLGLQRRPERLHGGVVEAQRRAAHECAVLLREQ